MWDEVQGFIESLLENYGVSRVLLGPFTLIALIAALGLLKGGTAALVGVAVSLFVAVVIITALTLQLRSTRELLAERARIVNLYTERFVIRESESYSVEDWDESVVIAKNGTTKLEKWVTIKVGQDSLYSVWSWIEEAGNSKGRNLSESERRGVTFEARSFAVQADASQSRVLGARYDVTREWNGNKLQLFIHFEQPARAGEVVRIWMRWEWPRYYKNLLDGNTGIVDWLMHRPTKRIAIAMTFDQSCKIRADFNITPHRDSNMPIQARGADGSLVVTWEQSDVPVDVKVGFRLDGRQLRR